jgi:hypothetical protein
MLMKLHCCLSFKNQYIIYTKNRCFHLIIHFAITCYLFNYLLPFNYYGLIS